MPLKLKCHSDLMLFSKNHTSIFFFSRWKMSHHSFLSLNFLFHFLSRIVSQCHIILCLEVFFVIDFCIILLYNRNMHINWNNGLKYFMCLKGSEYWKLSSGLSYHSNYYYYTKEKNQHNYAICFPIYVFLFKHKKWNCTRTVSAMGWIGFFLWVRISECSKDTQFGISHNLFCFRTQVLEPWLT